MRTVVSGYAPAPLFTSPAQRLAAACQLASEAADLRYRAELVRDGLIGRPPTGPRGFCQYDLREALNSACYDMDRTKLLQLEILTLL